MKTSAYTLLALFLLLMASSLAAATTVYKWRDANGQLHFSDKPPPTEQAEIITVKNPRRRAPAAEAETSPEPGTQPEATTTQTPAMSEEQKAAKEALARQQAAHEKNIRQRNCGIARRNLKTLKATVRVRKQNPRTGEWVRVSDAERLKKLKEYQRKVREYCR